MGLVLAELVRQPWAMTPTALGFMSDVLGRWAGGTRLDSDSVEALIGSGPADTQARRREAYDRRTGVAVLPLYGVLAHRAHMVQRVSGAGCTSTELFARAFEDALADPAVRSIVIDVDSPGGAVAGTPELADRIHAGRSRKPIVAVVNATGASAAYWIASAASEVVCTPSGMVGSIGVLAVHEDRSRALRARGVAFTLIHAGRFKVEGNSLAPLGADARSEMQRTVDQAYMRMTTAIGRYRGRSAAEVVAQFGQGRMLDARAALRAGMVDRVATLDDTILRMSGARPLAVVSGGTRTAHTPRRAAAAARLMLVQRPKLIR